MRRIPTRKLFAGLACLLFFGSGVAPVLAIPVASTPPKNSAAKASPSVSFEPNVGQTDPSVKFLARANGYVLFLTTEGSLVKLDSGESFKFNLVGGEGNGSLIGTNKLVSKVNYFLGAGDWMTDVNTYGGVRYESVYQGISLEYYSKNGSIEYDYVVEPFADPGVIKTSIGDVDTVNLLANGKLEIIKGGKKLVLEKPVSYQIVDGERTNVDSEFAFDSSFNLTFKIGDYDKNYSLVIDPVIDYVSFVGAEDTDFVEDVAIGNDGAIYVAGYSGSISYPQVNPLSTSTPKTMFFTGVVSKFAPDGTTLLYSTYLGGTNGDSRAMGIDVDESGYAYVTGITGSLDFPLLNPAWSTCDGCGGFFGSTKAFITKFNPAGNSLAYSTYAGSSGAFVGNDIAINTAGEAYITGYAGFGSNVLKLSADGSSFVYELGIGPSNSIGEAIGLDASGNAYIVGTTDNFGYPTVNAFQPAIGGEQDAFVTKVSADGTALVYSTFLGGSGIDRGIGIAVSPAGEVYVTGETRSANFPTQNALQPLMGDSDAFVAKFNSAGDQLVYSTFLGGDSDPGREEGGDIAINASGEAYVVGTTSAATNFPLVDPFQPSIGITEPAEWRSNVFISKLNAAGSAYLFSTYYGGNMQEWGTAVDLNDNGQVAVGGAASSANFATTPGAYQTTLANDPGGLDGFVMKITFAAANQPPTVDANGPYNVNEGGSVQVSATGNDPENQALTYAWDLDNNGSFETAGQTVSFSAVGLLPGNRQVNVRVTDPGNLAAMDTAIIQILDATTKDDFVALGHEGVWLKQGVVVNSGDVGANVASAGPFLDSGSEVSIGGSVSFVNAASKIFGDSVKLKAGSDVFDVFYNTLVDNGDTHGNLVTPLTLPVVPNFPTVPSFTAGTTDVTLLANTSQTLSAGSYKDLLVRSGATLTLTGGVYEFNSWDLRGGAKVYFAAPTEVRIVGKIGADSTTEVKPDPSSSITAKDIKIFVTGINGGSGNLGATPKAAQFGQNSIVQANIYAPNGTLILQQGATGVGAFLGKWVVMGENVELTKDSAF